MLDNLGSCACRIIVVVLLILVILLVLIILSQGGRGIFGGAEEADIEVVDQRIYDANEELEDMEGVEGGRRGKDIAIREPLFAKVASGEATQVARLNRGPFKDMAVGNVITVRRSRAPEDKTEFPGERRFKMVITSRKEYPTFTALLEKEGHKDLGYKSAKEALSHLHEFMPEADEKEHGVVVFGLKRA
jgi:ASC-1-like (ASCH) protein